jgi:hypothetical protein
MALQVNYKPASEQVLKADKTISVQKLLNITGGLMLLGLLVSIYTVPISINEELRLYYDDKLVLKGEKLEEFLSFVFAAGFAYFMLVRLYFTQRRLFYIFLWFILIDSILMVFILPGSH